MNTRCTAIGLIAGAAAIATGIACDMACMKKQNCSISQHMTSCVKQKAGGAMHVLGNKLNKAADDIMQ